MGGNHGPEKEELPSAANPIQYRPGAKRIGIAVQSRVICQIARAVDVGATSSRR